MPAMVKNIPFCFTVLGATTSLLLINNCGVNKTFIFEQKKQPLFRFVYTFLNKK